MTFKTSLLAVVALLAFNPMFAGDKDAPDGTRKLLDPANVDPAVKPGDNFFYYANGSWLKKNPVPGSETRWGSFNELLENNYASLHQLLDMAAENKNAEKGSPQQKVGDFYRTGMDEDAIKKAGLKPLQSIFKRIDAINAPEELLQEIALEHTEGITPLFNFYVSPDDKNVTKQVPQFSQGGLGMPDRDYYFNTDERTVKIKDAYKGYLNRMLKSIGSKEPQRMADMIFNLETQLAEASMTRVEMRDPYKLYNKYSLRQLNETSQRGFNWALTFRRLKIREADSLIIGQPEFFAKAGELLNKMPLEVWKEYLKFHVVNDMAPYLSNEFDELHFDFYGRTLRGQQEQKPRWKRVLQVVDNSIGEVLGQMYVDKYFKPEAKERMVELVTNLQTTYADRINRLSWMSNPTKKKALAKLNTFMKKIGYPDNWRDYSRLQITPDSYVENILNAAAFDYNYNLSKLGRPVDRSEWGMTPPTVNAYYNPAFNEIVFPAGILQYPFFEMSGDDAVNYGGIGAVTSSIRSLQDFKTFYINAKQLRVNPQFGQTRYSKT